MMKFKALAFLVLLSWSSETSDKSNLFLVETKNDQNDVDGGHADHENNDIKSEKMLGALQKDTNVGNVTNPGKAENGTDYQYISGSNYWNGNGRCCQIPWTTDAYGYYYCPPGRRCDRRSCPPGQRCNRRSLEGVLIIGGQGSEKSVEAFNPWTRRTCELRRSPKDAALATFCGGLLCGEDCSSDCSCRKWDGSRFVETEIHLARPRVAHMCWELPYHKGTLLLGGEGSSSESVELISQETYSKELDWELYFPARFSCGMEWTKGTFVVTGGVGQEKKVISYNRRGFKDNLRHLNIGRWDHACSSFISRGRRVMLVTGGRTKEHHFYLSSTEIYIYPKWEILKSMYLPDAITGARAVTINNVAYLFGGRTKRQGRAKDLKKILILKTPRRRPWSWQGAGVIMKNRRYQHAVGIVKNIYSLCD